jgi:hypothetical protein
LCVVDSSRVHVRDGVASQVSHSVLVKLTRMIAATRQWDAPLEKGKDLCAIAAANNGGSMRSNAGKLKKGCCVSLASSWAVVYDLAFSTGEIPPPFEVALVDS